MDVVRTEQPDDLNARFREASRATVRATLAFVPSCSCLVRASGESCCKSLYLSPIAEAEGQPPRVLCQLLLFCLIIDRMHEAF